MCKRCDNRAVAERPRKPAREAHPGLLPMGGETMGRIVATSLPIALFFTLASTVALAQGQSRNLDSLDNDELTAELGRAGSYKQRLQTRETLIARGRQSIPSLADSLETGNEAQKMESLALLQGFRSKASVPKIVPLLRDPDEKVRVRAAFSLGKIGDPVVLPDPTAG